MGNSKESHRKTWYFCNAPHRFHVNCHTHTTNTCRTRIRMLEDQGDSNPTSNAANAPLDSKLSQADTDISSISDATDYSNVTSLLSYTFNIMGNYPEANDTVASDLMALNQI